MHQFIITTICAFFVLACTGQETQPTQGYPTYPPPQPTQGNAIQTAQGAQGTVVAPQFAPAVPATRGTPQAPVPKPAPAPATPAAQKFAWEPTISRAGGMCSVGQATSLGGKEGRLKSMQIGFGEKGGLVAWPMDNDRAQIIPLNKDGTVTEVGSVVDITAAQSLNEILPLGDSFMLATHAVCPDKKFFFKCLHHRLLDGKGKPTSSQGTTITKEWLGIDLAKRNWQGDVMRLWSFMYIPPKVHSFSAAGGTLKVEDIATLEGLGEVVEAEAFAVDGNQWYAILRDEAGDGGHIFLSKAGARTKMTWLPSSHRVIALNRAKTGFGLLYRVGDNPSRGGRMVSISLDGQRMSDPIKLQPGALPAPFDDDMSVELSVKKRELWMTRHDAAGRKVGDPVRVGIGLRGDRDDAPYKIAWTGERFVVTYGTIEGGQWKFYAAPVQCSGLAR